MNEVINKVLTMNSREIAMLVNKKHPHVIRDIRNMLIALGLDAADYESTFMDQNNNPRTCFELPKDLTLTLVTGYDIPRRHAINKRWLELEEQLRTGELQVNQQFDQQQTQMMTMMQAVIVTVEKMGETLNQMGEMLNRMNAMLDRQGQEKTVQQPQTIINVNSEMPARAPLALPRSHEYSTKQVSACLFTLRLFGEALRMGDVDPIAFPHRREGNRVVMKSDTVTNFLYSQPELYELASRRGIISSHLITKICKSIGAIVGRDNVKNQPSHHHFLMEYFV
ncbi:Rha family transcriptional regulator [Vibrio cholerae]|nr:Rha family transcriptional regulator [Vibrio cholerae]EKA4530330.1 Rha family transcriptional regulator [Vibrio cholerae]EKF9203485.1 Rha family transcriptional regulator [Vibrio cholerae]